MRPTSKSVPHYEQQADFTCGPACLMMIFRYYDRRFQMNTKNEMDIWRQSALAPLPPTGRYGLAFAALSRGLSAEMLSNVAGMEYINKTPRSLVGRGGAEWTKRMYGLMEEQFKERRARALELGLKERIVKDIDVDDLESGLSRGGLHVLLTSARFFDDEDWAHWVVVTGVDEQSVFINDPASPTRKGRRVFSRRDFQTINGYYGDQVAISISKRPRTPSAD